MKPIARYTFMKNPEKTTRYFLISHSGESIVNFPGIYKRGEDKGKKYIGFRPPQSEGQMRRGFTHIITTNDNITFTGITTTTTEPNKGYGDTFNTGGNHAVLVALSDDKTTIEIYIFLNQGNNSKALFGRWTANDLCMTVDPISIGQEKSPQGGNQNGQLKQCFNVNSTITL